MANREESIIEALLFASGEPVAVAELSAILDMPNEAIREKVEKMQKEWDAEEQGLRILTLEDGYQICTRDCYFPYIQKLVEPRRQQPLSQAALEVLAIIAYQQPVTRSVIEEIRGCNSDSGLARLIERGLCEEQGRLDAPGRPMLYGTTTEFLRAFGLTSIQDLPEPDGLTEIEKLLMEREDDAEQPENQ